MLFSYTCRLFIHHFIKHIINTLIAVWFCILPLSLYACHMIPSEVLAPEVYHQNLPLSMISRSNMR